MAVLKAGWQLLKREDLPVLGILSNIKAEGGCFQDKRNEP